MRDSGLSEHQSNAVMAAQVRRQEIDQARERMQADAADVAWQQIIAPGGLRDQAIRAMNPAENLAAMKLERIVTNAQNNRKTRG